MVWRSAGLRKTVSRSRRAANGNLIYGNLIGVSPDGSVAQGNKKGIEIMSSGNRIGGPDPASRNVVSGNQGPGLRFLWSSTTGNIVENNYIGVSSSGEAAVPNTSAGIVLQGARNNIIGGTTPDRRNVISGNIGGIDISNSAQGNQIQGNYIGPSATGGTIAGGGTGVSITGDTTVNNVLGGTVAGAGNLISGNSTGVLISLNAADNDILRNTITGSMFQGVAIVSGSRNQLSENAIYANGQLGIDLGQNGVTTNDTGDLDTGANDLQNFPVLTTSVTDGSNLTVFGALTSTPNETFLLEYFRNTLRDPSQYGEGELFVGSHYVTTDASGNFVFSCTFAGTGIAVGDFVTATATDHLGNTSEFSAGILTRSDADADGVPDDVENGASNGGDGNGDGVADGGQLYVTSLPNALDGRYVTLVSPASTAIHNVTVIENPSPSDAPTDVEFPIGFVGFDVVNVAQGGETPLTLLLPPDSEYSTYYKFGPTPDNRTPHWYEFLFDGTTGAEISGNQVVLHLVDGLRGDDDLTLNGIIRDVGTPADHLPVIHFDTTSYRVTEDDTSIVIRATLTDPTSKAVVVPVTATGTLRNELDYSLSSAVLAFAPYTLEASLTLTVYDDTLDEDLEFLAVTMQPTSGVILDTSGFYVEVLDDDPRPTVSFSQLSQCVDELNQTIFIEATLSAPSGLDVTVPLIIRGSASTRDDYTLTDMAILIAAGATTGRMSVAIVDDALGEGNETIIITMQTPTNATLPDTSATSVTTEHMITIRDNDSPSVSFDSTSWTVDEGGTVTVTATLSARWHATIEVPLSVGTQSPPAGSSDYLFEEGWSQSLVFAPGSESASVTITAVDDFTSEYPEYIRLSMNTPSGGASLGKQTAATVVIRDNDYSKISLDHDSAEYWERNGLLYVTVTICAPAQFDVWVDVTARDGSADNQQATMCRGPRGLLSLRTVHLERFGLPTLRTTLQEKRRSAFMLSSVQYPVTYN